MSKPVSGRFNGYHMTAILVVFFGVVMAVNFTMAALARSSFGGVVVENSYVASQKYNGWLAQAEEQRKLGWSVASQRLDDGRLLVTASGVGPQARLSAVARHPLGRFPDTPIVFARQGDGSFVSRDALPSGRWTVRYELSQGDAIWRHEEAL